jgi:polar amino acid transport system permease protein
MDFELIQRVYPFFLEAAWVTIQLSILTTILGLSCGALGAHLH